MAEGSGRGDRALFETGEGRNVGAERSGARIGDAASRTGYGAGRAPEQHSGVSAEPGRRKGGDGGEPADGRRPRAWRSGLNAGRGCVGVGA